MKEPIVMPWTIDDMSKILTTLSEKDKILIVGFLAGLKIVRQADLSNQSRSA